MATIIKDNAGKNYVIRLTENESPTGRRAKITCGGMTKNKAVEVKQHIQRIVVAKKANIAFEVATATWLGKLRGSIRSRLEELGLIDSLKSVPDVPEHTVVRYVTDYINGRTDLSASTVRIYSRALHFAESYFGNETLLADVSPGMAKKFGTWLRAPGRKSASEGLGDNTAKLMIRQLKTIFKSAIDYKVLDKNPFQGMATAINVNENNQTMVESADVLKVMEHAVDEEFKAIIALARFGGLRTPSEFRYLKHGDFSKQGGHPVFEVYCQKTAHTGKSTRMVPVFADLAPHLKGLVSSDSRRANDFVFSPRYRDSTDANIYNTFERAIRSAGLEQWPDLWRNLRGSRAAELIDARYPLKNVANWLGNNPDTNGTAAVFLRAALRLAGGAAIFS